MQKFPTARRLSRRRLLLGGGSMLSLGLLGLRGWNPAPAMRATAAPPDGTMKSRAVVQSVAADGPLPVNGPGAAGVAVAEYLPAGTTRFGAWVPGAPWDLAPLSTIERQIGQPLGIVMWYQGWGAGNAPLDVALLDRVAARNALPMITWEPWDYTKGVDQPEYRLKRITSGAFDTYIRSWADGLRDWGKPMVLRFAHEMNHNKYPWCVNVNENSPADFVAAWRHVRSIFAAAGATNVAFHWCPNADWAGSGKVPFSEIYPGDSNVDIVGVDGYNGGTDLDWGGWQTFSAIFGYSISALGELTAKPIVIGEVASAETGGSKAAWVGDMLAKAVPVTFPNVRGVVWFNENRETHWEMQSSAASLDAFRAGLLSNHYVLHDVTA